MKPDTHIFFKIRKNTDIFHTDNIFQNYHTDKSILINFRKLKFTDKTQTDKIWKIDEHTDKTINFRITKLLIKKNLWDGGRWRVADFFCLHNFL